MAFCHLHLHTTYSFLDGYGLPAEIMKKVAAMGQKSCAVTDHGNTSGWVQWDIEAKKNGVKPIFGCEFYLTDDINNQTQKKQHLTVVAKNLEGYRNILRLTTLAWSKGFYYKPTIDWEMLSEHKEGLIVMSGCISSKLSVMIRDGKTEKEIDEELARQRSMVDDYFIEISPMRFEEGRKAIEGLILLAKRHKIKMVAACDSHYVNKEDSQMHEVLLAIQSNAKWEDPLRWKFDQDDFYVKSEEEMIKDLTEIFPAFKKDVIQAVKNTDYVANLCESFDLPKAHNMRFPTKVPAMKLLEKMAKAGLKVRMKAKTYKDINPEYRKRLEYELSLVEQKDFADYFLIIADLINWAKNTGILVGPARGSSAGSVACWALKITEVDPIRWGLLFERFIDVNRKDLPDIDIDFQDDRRKEIKEYLEKKYGREKVSGIATFIKFKGKLCVQDIARVFSIPPAVVETLRPLFVERSGGDSRASFTISDMFKEFDIAKEALIQYPELHYAEKMEGQLRQYSAHAAGMVISNEPLENFVAVYERDGDRVISLEKYDAEKLGLLKIDVLGLNTLTVIKRCAELIHERHGVEVDFYNMELEDPKVYEAFRKGKMFGVFQFEGESMYSVTRQVVPENFKHLSDIMALARPGPLHSGGTQKYIQRKASGEEWHEAHPLIEEMAKDTYGVVIYQEQVMRILREIGQMSWEDTSAVRKAMSGRLGTEFFNRYKAKFDEGALQLGLEQSNIDDIWNSICTFGSWAMNKSHTISYSLLSYWTMWLKVTYPIEFYASIFEKSSSEERVTKVLKEFRREGFHLYDPDINASKEKFSIYGDGIIIGLSDIKGVGEKVAEKIVQGQPYQVADSIPASKNMIKTFERVGALRSIGGNTSKQLSLFSSMEEYEWHRPDDNDLRPLCPPMVPIEIPKDIKSQVSEVFHITAEPIERLSDESDRYGVAILCVISNKNLKDINEVSASRGQGDQRELSNPELVKYVNFLAEDETDSILITVNRYAYPHLQELVWSTKDQQDVLLVVGTMKKGIRKLYAKKIFNFTLQKAAKVPQRKRTSFQRYY